MKKSVLKAIVCVAVFFTALFIVSAITNKGNTDMTVEMEPATYPLVYMNYSGNEINCLHGYASEMQASYLRDTITPINEGRSVSFRVDKYGRDIKKLTVEVRSLDGKRLIESTEIPAYTEDKDEITASVTLKDLIEENEEYTFILLLETDTETIRYYTRIIQTVDYYVNDKIAFAKAFHEKVFLKDESIAKYLESNAEGDNSTFQKVDIHCSFSQVTWGNLAVKKLSEPVVSIKELGTQTASIRLDYYVGIDDVEYRVSEFYRMRYGKERMYLLDYERTMSQFFDAGDDAFVNNKILIGIAGDVEMKESEDGNVIAFKQENSLYCYNATDNKCIRLFSFYNTENGDFRDVYNKHNMKILSVEETGNVRFMVYGYMNRGRHEGNVGVQIYYYNNMLNTVEEDAFISYQKSYELLGEDIEKLSYVSKNNIFYFILEGTIYSIDLTNKTSEVVAKDLKEDSFKVSVGNEMVVWQTGTERYSNSQLNLMNLNTKKRSRIEAGEGNRIAPLGFMGVDLIYGIADQNDIVKDKSGFVTFPMNRVVIQNENGEVLEEYSKERVYVTGGTIQENMLTLKRVKKVGETVEGEAEAADMTEDKAADMTEDKAADKGTQGAAGISSVIQYEEIKDEQIVSRVVKEVGKNTIELVTTEKYGKIVEIALKSSVKTKTLKILEPKEVLFEGGREIMLVNKTLEMERYYVYGKDGVAGVYAEPAEAINQAYNISGVVLNDTGNYVWVKSNLLIKNQIMKISAVKAEDFNSIAVCLDTILKYEGITKNTEYLLQKGATFYSILEDNLEDAQVLMLSGCSLESVLYYVNRDIPVMALQQDGNAVLIIGFNELNTVLMDPLTGTIYKKGMNDSKEWFAENGNSFITYVKN